MMGDCGIMPTLSSSLENAEVTDPSSPTYRAEFVSAAIYFDKSRSGE